jgi:hypothetical protein
MCLFLLMPSETFCLRILERTPNYVWNPQNGAPRLVVQCQVIGTHLSVVLAERLLHEESEPDSTGQEDRHYPLAPLGQVVLAGKDRGTVELMMEVARTPFVADKIQAVMSGHCADHLDDL